MKIFDQIKKVFNVNVNVKSASVGFKSDIFSSYRDKSRKTIRNDTDMMGTYSGHAAIVSACVDAITRDVVSQKLTFRNSKNGEIIDNSRVPKNILAPYIGNWQGLWLRDVMNVIVPSKLLTGNAFIWNRQGTAYGAVHGIRDVFVPVPAQDVKIQLNVSGEGIDYYDVRMGGMSYQVPPDEMIHIRQNPIYSPFVGVGNVTKARLLIEGEYSSTEYINAFLNEAQGSPTMIIVDPVNMIDEEKYRMSSMLKSKWSPKIMYMNMDKDAKIIHNSLLTKDFDFLEKRRFDMDQIIAVFGVPKIVLGIPDGSNKSTSGNQIPLYYKSVVNPCIKEISYFLTNHHVRKYSQDIEVSLETHASGDINDVRRMLLSGIITPNRAAELMGQDVDMSDDSRNTYYIPSSVNVISVNGESVPGFAHTNDVGGGSTGDGDGDGDGEGAEKFASKNLGDPRNTDAIVEHFNKSTGFKRLYQAQFLKKGLTSRNAIEEKYAGVISEYFEVIELGVIDIFKKEFNVKKSYDLDGLSDVQDSVGIYLTTGIPSEKDMLRPLHTSGVQRAIVDINTIVGSGINASFSNPFVKGAVDNLGEKSEGILISEIKKDLREIFAKALADGLKSNVIETAISAKFNQYKTTTARIIARIEARSAWNAGAQVAYNDIGVEKVDVIGCSMSVWNSEGGKKNIPVSILGGLVFHTDHIGVLAPSK